VDSTAQPPRVDVEIRGGLGQRQQWFLGHVAMLAAIYPAG
jgi:hypothetical protein